MTQAYRPFFRALLIFTCAVPFLVAGCSKKPVSKSSGTFTPPPSTVKPTVTISADRTSVNKGESARLTWSSTDAQNVSIAPEVGAVTPQGSTSVTPAESTTYTVTASGPGGNADSSVRISVNAPPAAVVTEVPKTSSLDQLFLEEVRDAYFDYDSAEIRPDAREALRKTADFLKKYPNMRITIQGHCDERGSTEYNLALGDRRANAVKAYLISLGIPSDRFSTVSFGKEKPFCMETTEACYAQNRRGHFVQTK
jgi:peptidoglycan-associated lipoprotein